MPPPAGGRRLLAALPACCARPALFPASLRSTSSAHHLLAPPCCHPCLLRQRWHCFSAACLLRCAAPSSFRLYAASTARTLCRPAPRTVSPPHLMLLLSPHPSLPPRRLSTPLFYIPPFHHPPLSVCLFCPRNRQGIFWSLFCAALFPSKRRPVAALSSILLQLLHLRHAHTSGVASIGLCYLAMQAICVQ